MYPLLLALHNTMRWVVVVLALWALWQAWSGWLGKRDYTATDRRSALFFTISLDIQVVLGLILYFISPITTQAMSDMGAAMSAGGATRFYTVEHATMMIIAVVLAHVGSAIARRGTDAVKKHRSAAIWFTLAVLAVLAGIPWQYSSLIPGM